MLWEVSLETGTPNTFMAVTTELETTTIGRVPEMW